jgi:hypothetical protein
VNTDPFGALGLPARPGLTDDDVRAAWRRIAAATHPDRADGGDPDRFAEASAAYTALRTRFGRGEAYAALTATARSHAPAPARPATRGQDTTSLASPVPRATPGPAGAETTSPPATASTGRFGLIGRIGRGRPVLLVIRLAVAAAVCAVAFVVTGAQPAAIGLSVGVATWFLLTARRDLAPPRRR